MFAQENVMGIKKEREAFEAWFESQYDAHFMQFALDLDLYVDKHTQTCWEAWQAAKAHEAEKLKGCVLVPVQCPDPDFADSLFDELSKKAIGEFGDDLLIHFSDIDEEKIWALMVEAAKAQAVPEGFVLVPREPSADLVNHGHQVFLGHFNEGGQTGGRSLYFAYKAMIEAQEQK